MEKMETLLANLEPAQKEKQAFAILRAELIAEIDYLIQHNFSQLVFILYKYDVDETALKKQLQDTGNYSAETIADIIIERQLAKLETRKQFKTDTSRADEAELF